MPSELLRTALFNEHVALNARRVPFAGWEMPLQYQPGIIAEHKAVRSSWGIFDVSHMGRLIISGAGGGPLIDYLVTSNIVGLKDGQARYGLVCLESGGILDDVVVLRLARDEMLLVCNASNRETVLQWAQDHSPRFPQTKIRDETSSTVMIAAQGPHARQQVDSLFGGATAALRRFCGGRFCCEGTEAIVSRTGYTGEDGYEVILPAAAGSEIWRRLHDLGAVPCGLGARDTLRLEAGLALHGQDIDETTNPIEAGLERFVEMNGPHFIGKTALEETIRIGLQKRLGGFIAPGRGAVPRHQTAVVREGQLIGTVTSGAFGPSVQAVIGLAYLPPALAEPANTIHLRVRDKILEAQTTTLPFYHRQTN